MAKLCQEGADEVQLFRWFVLITQRAQKRGILGQPRYCGQMPDILDIGDLDVPCSITGLKFTYASFADVIQYLA